MVKLVLLLFLLIAFGGPLALGFAGFVGREEAKSERRSAGRWSWRLMAASTLLYVLAFNLVFFIQELFLVIPKALTPSLDPVLFHNNHDWTGDDPLARLFQGCGALAILLVGLVAIALLRTRPFRSTTLHLFLVWIAYQGLFQAIPQVVAGSILPQNDVGMAMDYLSLSQPAMMVSAVAAILTMAAAGIWLARPVLSLADGRADIDSRGGRSRFVLQVATLPSLAAVPLILPFRVPGSLDQVVFVPVAVTMLGIMWVQASAWRAVRNRTPGPVGTVSLSVPLLALAAVLTVFQILLRPGVPF